MKFYWLKNYKLINFTSEKDAIIALGIMFLFALILTFPVDKYILQKHPNEFSLKKSFSSKNKYELHDNLSLISAFIINLNICGLVDKTFTHSKYFDTFFDGLKMIPSIMTIIFIVFIVAFTIVHTGNYKSFYQSELDKLRKAHYEESYKFNSFKYWGEEYHYIIIMIVVPIILIVLELLSILMIVYLYNMFGIGNVMKQAIRVVL